MEQATWVLPANPKANVLNDHSGIGKWVYVI